MVAIPRNLTAEDYKSLSDEDKALYSHGEDGNFTFIGENAPELKRAKLRVSQENKEMRKEMADLKKTLEDQEKSRLDADADEARKKGDIDKIDAAWKNRFDTEIAAREEKLAAMQRAILNQHKEAVITKAVAEHALPGKENYLKLYLQTYLKVEADEGGSPKVVVLDDKTQKATKLTVDKLLESMHTNKEHDFALRGTSGSGAKDEPTIEPQINPYPDRKIGDPGQTKPLTTMEKVNDFMKFHKSIRARLADGVSTVPEHERNNKGLLGLEQDQEQGQ